ncbi:ABC1 kinase family protein [Tepidiforma bonchosmolovskayae]|uniref:AarF/ABC1/UbiB kinase family protein n=1 Tax=Tepidiforma bonchosmolovskayae TaxID=2601677 RepID=A0ABX6C083_9CHLR|nr:AarF/ABC1/UbiB kinase family protein [Tepidiforma bonchosmolovskayae]QFG02415.1 AarF/ABC1/UbiB kinase family protein [Tepidiforma bonchosmolovskayae]
MATGRTGSAMRTGRLARTAVPARLAAAAALRWLGTFRYRGERRREKRKEAVLRTAEDVTRAMGEMKGAAMKVGQVLSMMSGVVPPEMAEGLATLQSNAPPMAYGLVQEVLEAAYGRSPGSVFRRFEREPFAAASIGQVHRAELRDGTRVAVKVQYPGVREAIERDLANVAVLLGFGGLVAKGLDVETLVRDLGEGIRGELDYRREAAWQRRFFDAFEGHGFVRVPRVYHELTTDTVLVQEWLPGRPFREALGLPQGERNRLGEMLYRFCFGSLYRLRLFNGDPHPGNYLLLEDGRVGFVDYGCVAEFDNAVVEGFKRLIRALDRGDREAWRAATEEVGILLPNAPFTTDELYEHMHWYLAPILEDEVEYTPELAAEMVRRNTMTTGLGGQINRYCNVPEGMVFLTRINFGLAGLFASLRARGPWRAIVREYVDDAPPSTELGRLSAATTRSGKPI